MSPLRIKKKIARGAWRHVTMIGVVLMPVSTVTGQQIVTANPRPLLVTSPSGRPAQYVSVALPTDQGLIAIEGETNSILLLADDGRLQARTANTGRGAAMLAYPIGITSRGPADFIVLDAQTPRLAHFMVTADTVSLSSVLRLRGLTGVSDVCSVENTLFVLGQTPPDTMSQLIHIVSERGEPLRSFGAGFGPSNEVSRILFGSGHLECYTGLKRITVASRYYPEVRAYGVRGELLWRLKLTDFRQISYEQPAPGHVRYVYPADSLWDQTISTFAVNKHILGVQVGRTLGRRPNGAYVAIRTILISLDEGRILGVQSNLPLILAATPGRLVVAGELGTLQMLSYAVRESS